MVNEFNKLLLLELPLGRRQVVRHLVLVQASRVQILAPQLNFLNLALLWLCKQQSHFFCERAQESFKVTMRLNTGAPGLLSLLSAIK